MSFQSNIPKTTDLISVSQGDLLNNFTSMQSTFAVDHYGFNPAANLGFHKHVTMTNDPGNVPAPAVGFGSAYATTVNSATYPFWQRDNTGTPYSLLPIKAFGGFTANNPAVSVFTLPYGNIATIVRTSPNNFTVTFTDALPNATYLTIVTTTSSGTVPGFVSQSATNFVLTTAENINTVIKFIIVF